MAKKKLKEPKEKVLKEFNIDFDELILELPNNAQTTIIISEQLLINKDLPTDILFKMSRCASVYARYGSIRGDLMSYQSLLNDRFDISMKTWKNEARIAVSSKGGKAPSESALEEHAVLKHLVEYRSKKKQIYKVDKALEKIKRVMRAVEIQSDMSRSIASYMKKEMGLTDDESRFLKQGRHGKFSEDDS